MWAKISKIQTRFFNDAGFGEMLGVVYYRSGAFGTIATE
jgi:hypothetical protein